MTQPLELVFVVACSRENAFATWAEKTSLWWPPSHSVSGDPLAVTIEPRPGGRIYERTRDGAEHDWGEVTAWEPLSRLGYVWHLRQDRTDASHVEITFTPTPEGTSVAIVHSGWERLGARAEELRQRNERAWASLLPHYRRAAGG